MTSNESPFRMGLVGCGRISQAYIQAIDCLPDVKLVSAMDVEPDAVKTTAEATGSRGFTDLESFMDESALEGAIICTPPRHHEPVSCALLERGIHVLCEKPFATNRTAAMRMINAAKERNMVLMMASKFRYVEDITRAKSIVQSGTLGDIHFFENRFLGQVNMKDRWNSDPELSGGGVLIDNGTHSVDIVRYLFGPVTSIHAHTGRQLHDLPVEETGFFSFTANGNVIGNVYLSWSLKIEEDAYIKIHGTEGSLTIGWKESKYHNNGHFPSIPFGVGYNKIEAFRRNVGNFVNCVKRCEEPIITLEDALASVLVIESAYESMQNNACYELIENDFEECMTANK